MGQDLELRGGEPKRWHFWIDTDWRGDPARAEGSARVWGDWDAALKPLPPKCPSARNPGGPWRPVSHGGKGRDNNATGFGP